jgi:phosphoglycolate phosphatase
LSLKLAVFDIDGTLVDSRQNIARAAREAAAELGLPDPGYDAVRQIVGLSLREALGVLEPGLDEQGLDAFVGGFQASFTRMHSEPGYREPLYEGAQEILERLHRDGWKIAMATGNSRKGVGRLLENHNWADLFVSTHCADDGPGKPHPSMLLSAMAAVGAGPASTVMIGDTSHDMRMAVAAEVYGQGVSWGFHTTEEVLASGAAHVAHTFAELEAELDAFASGIGAARRAG